MSCAATFCCKRCRQPKPAADEVVTRFRTRTCRTCWGRLIAKGKRADTGLPEDVCSRCGKNPRRPGSRRGNCKSCEDAYRIEWKEKNKHEAGTGLIPRETHADEHQSPK